MEDSNAIKYALYTRDTVTVVRWLERQGVKTRAEAAKLLGTAVGAIISFDKDGNAIGNLGNLKAGLDKIGKHYKE
jgi:hypothetical protein